MDVEFLLSLASENRIILTYTLIFLYTGYHYYSFSTKIYLIWIALSVLPCAQVLWVRDEKQLKIIRRNDSGQWVMGNAVHDEITKMEGVPSDLVAIICTPADRHDSADAIFICLTISHDSLNETCQTTHCISNWQNPHITSLLAKVMQIWIIWKIWNCCLWYCRKSGRNRS